MKNNNIIKSMYQIQPLLVVEPTRSEKIEFMIRRCMDLEIEIPQNWINEYNNSVINKDPANRCKM